MTEVGVVVRGGLTLSPKRTEAIKELVSDGEIHTLSSAVCSPGLMLSREQQTSVNDS